MINDPEIKKFWAKVNNLDTSGFFITTYFSSNPTLRYAKNLI